MLERSLLGNTFRRVWEVVPEMGVLVEENICSCQKAGTNAEPIDCCELVNGPLVE